jgi:putative FmdB family regulatory protein
MPIYEYVCKSCKQEFEIIRPMSQKDAPLECEKCGSKKVKRKLSVFSARNESGSVAGTSGGCDCGSCSGGNCNSCGH